MLNRRLVGLLLTLIAAGGMWLYVRCVLIPHQKADAAARQAPRGNLSDLYPRWLGARELLLHQRDPYGDDITREIQVGYYGRALDPTLPSDPKDQQAFAYPIYVVLMLAPTVSLPFATVHRAAFWLFGLLTVVSVPLWLHTLGWRISITSKVLWILLTVSCLPALQGLRLQQLTVLVAALVAAVLSAVIEQKFVLAGALLAVATVKPQLVFLLVLWLCIWISGNWRERRRLLWSFAITMAVMVGAGEMLLPGWIHEFRVAIASYYRYTGGGNSVLDVVLSPLVGRITAAAAVGMLFLFTWKVRRASQKAPQFQWSLAFVFATTLLVIPMSAPYNQLLLVPAFMVIFRAMEGLSRRSRLSRFIVTITMLSVLWPFFACTCLVIALLWLPAATVQRAWGLPFYSTFAVPILIYTILLASRQALSSSEFGYSSNPRVLQPDAAAE